MHMITMIMITIMIKEQINIIMMVLVTGAETYNGASAPGLSSRNKSSFDRHSQNGI